MGVYNIIDANNNVVNTILWDGSTPYNLADGQSISYVGPAPGTDFSAPSDDAIQAALSAGAVMIAQGINSGGGLLGGGGLGGAQKI